MPPRLTQEQATKAAGDLMRDVGNDWHGPVAELSQKVESFISILLTGFDLSARSFDTDQSRIRLVRDALSYAVKMYGREGDTERLMAFVRELAEMRQPTYASLIDFIKGLQLKRDPSFQQLIEKMELIQSYEKPSFEQMMEATRRWMVNEDKKSDRAMQMLQTIATLVAGAIISFISYKWLGVK